MVNISLPLFEGYACRRCCSVYVDVSTGFYYDKGNRRYDTTCKKCRSKNCRAKYKAGFGGRRTETAKEKNRESMRASEKNRERSRLRYHRMTATPEGKHLWQERRKRNPAKKRARDARRRARKRGASGSHTQEQWEQLCARYNYCCLQCGKQKPLTRDHVLPVSCGGSDNIENIQPLCGACNSEKHTKHIDYRLNFTV
jgi:5-methylcytosine-specific restriction endonuclease McrA